MTRSLRNPADDSESFETAQNAMEGKTCRYLLEASYWLAFRGFSFCDHGWEKLEQSLFEFDELI